MSLGFRFLVPVAASILVLFFFSSGTRLQHKSVLSTYEPDVLVILMYHKVNPDPREGGLGLRVPPSKFDWQMKYLKTRGFTVIDMDSACFYLRYGRPLPPKPVVITFDDGYRDNYLFAWPILKKYGFCATVYHVVNATGGYNFFDADRGSQPRSSMLGWNEIREMTASGTITFGAHTLDHRPLTKVGPEEASRQIFGAKEVLEQELGRPVNHFCYPYGDYNREVSEMVKAAGFKTAVTCVRGVNHPGEDLFTLKRIRIMGNCSNRKFIYMLENCYKTAA
ncbi:MAG: polysaccharide deacetylase family protein [Ammonifex sp.]|nr:MAG: polysaccharide deacetylase family protein [Ammonifex sp.]